MTEQPTVTLSGFELIERIGRGGMGEVWRAERTGPGGVRRRAAVKRILSKYQTDPTLRERFIAEARTNSRLEHPNIVQVLDFGDSPELHLVLEYVEGAPVSALLQGAHTGFGELSVMAACFIAAEAATGLDYAHRRTDDAGKPLGIVHRDVSPQNILVSIDGAVKVNDFGIARASDNVIRTVAGVALGKQPYMAPEQILGESIDRRADVFALGIVLWELLTCRPLLPRSAPDQIIAALSRCDFQAPSQFRAGIPPELDAIVAEALARSPEKRTQSAARLAQALRKVLSSLSPGYDSGELARVVPVLVPDIAARVSGVKHTAEMPARLPPSPAPVPSYRPPASLPPTGVANGAVTPATPVIDVVTTPQRPHAKPIPPTVVWRGPPPASNSMAPPQMAPMSGSMSGSIPAPMASGRASTSRAPLLFIGAVALLALVVFGGAALSMLGDDSTNDSPTNNPRNNPTVTPSAGGACEHFARCCDATLNVPNAEFTRASCDALNRYRMAGTEGQRQCAEQLQFIGTQAVSKHVELPAVCH